MLKKLYDKYKDVIPYAFFGALTTLVNTAVYWACAHPLNLPVVASTVIAWFLAVLFAYITNRKWVFHSSAATRREIASEMLSFYLCRLATGILDWVCMYFFVDVLHLNDLAIKISANILVIILNYVASKLFIFKKKDEDRQKA